MNEAELGYWRVLFDAQGRITSVEQVGSALPNVVIVRARDAAEAKHKAYNIYCARKKQLAKERLRASGKCCCGRPQDVPRPSGNGLMFTCATCQQRSKRWKANHEERKKNPPPTPHVRDEAARVASNLSRQRDRRAEIRLETLVEVREQWFANKSVGAFGQWLAGEIERATKANRVQAA